VLSACSRIPRASRRHSRCENSVTMSVSSSRVVAEIAAWSRSLVIAPQYQPGDERRRVGSSPEVSRAWMDGVPAVRKRLA